MFLLDIEDSLMILAKKLSSLDDRWRARELSIVARLKNYLLEECVQITKPASSLYYWSDLFLKAKRIENERRKQEELSQLSDDFITYATQYSETIVRELSIPEHLKTIRSVGIGGVAGGDKFIAW